MEPVKVSRRGRKRKNVEIQNVCAEVDKVEKLDSVDDNSTRLFNSFVGRYVKKEFAGSGVFLGKVVYYDSGLYRVDYEDGDCEDLESGEIRSLLVEENEMKGGLRSKKKKKKLDDQVARKSYLMNDDKPTNEVVVVVEASPLVDTETGRCDEGSTVENESPHVDGVEDSSSYSCEFVHDRESSLKVETVLVPAPELPLSSGTVGVPDEYVSHLFSVYTFLRSFSIRLFLSPFGLDDFVGSLHTSSPNSLLDAVHTSLLRALSRHLQTLASEGGSEQASKCQRGVDWRLLDLLTWPVYLFHYLIVMGHSRRPEWKGFSTDLIDVEYYSLPTAMKLVILQILCDDVLDFSELRAEIDMREEEEVGMNSDVTTKSPLESVPRRVHPRNSKTSASKDREVLKITAESHKINSSESKGDSEAEDVDIDANSDECQICGMDGTLLCCDGCPSAYHSRCIGVSKVSIPEGSWFCPECVINKTSPIVTVDNSLRGAEMFGTDSYGRLFMAACSHLLVLNASADTESHVRYYSQIDIPNVLQTLNSSAEHTAMYYGICKSILQYWKVPETTFALPERVERSVEAPVENIGSVCSTLSPHPSVMLSHNARQSVAEGTLDSCVSNVEKIVTISNNTLAIKTQPGVSCLRQSGDLTNHKLSDMSFEDFARSSTNTNSCIDKQGISTVVPAKMLSRTGEVCNVTGGRNVSPDCLYTGSLFESFSYFNNYSHGEFAASAAASLAIVTSEEKVSDDRASDNSRKFLAANIALQVKSFSLIANRFFWPYFERKHGEVPRERCGWCLGCRSPPSNKKACLLNSAALNAIRNAMKILAKLCPIKSGVGNLPKIATYMLYMEESLRGLTVGPFLSATYRRNWHKQVKEASAINELKSLLLELEENIRPITLSADWVKLVDNRLNEASATCNASNSVGQTQKRAQGRPGRKSKKQRVDSGPIESSPAQNTPSFDGKIQKRGVGRPSLKQPVISKVISSDGEDTSDDICWWRGCKQSEAIFQKATLPLSIIKKASRTGGKRKILGVDYTEGSSIPRRSTQLIWRAAVEMSKNLSQLALQVRYLDFHVKWSDLSRSEQTVQEGKGGGETEASAFRNAVICDKKVTDEKIMYALAFGNQKHLPYRVMKNIIDTEQDEEGKDKLWFDEMRIPIYLIKEYEEKAEKASLPSDHKPPNSLSKLQKRQLKASRKDAFAYLVRRRDNWDKCSCASCQLDVILGNAVKCSACEGYCHQSCTISSTDHANVGIQITCKRCYDANTLRQKEIANSSPTTPLQASGYQKAGTVVTSAKLKIRNQSLASSVTIGSASVSKKNRNNVRCWGIIYKKKKGELQEVEDNGVYFRLSNILQKGDPAALLSKPCCCLCQKPYNAALTYIQCGRCRLWYHGEAVELEDARIPEVVGFKCFRCRRQKSPECPYGAKPEGTNEPSKVLKQATDPIPQIKTKKLIVRGPMNPMLPKKEEPASFSRDNTIANDKAELGSDCGNVSGIGPRKLPVRRQMKHEDDTDGFVGNNYQSRVESASPLESNGLSSPVIEWDVSFNGFEDEAKFDIEGFEYGDMEFEPQTYFSFNELMASEDEGGGMDKNDATAGLMGNNNMDTFTNEEYFGTDELDGFMAGAPACTLCSKNDPPPELFCQTCSLLIHSHCSTWVEDSSFGEDKWKCGNCREWQ